MVGSPFMKATNRPRGFRHARPTIFTFLQPTGIAGDNGPRGSPRGHARRPWVASFRGFPSGAGVAWRLRSWAPMAAARVGLLGALVLAGSCSGLIDATSGDPGGSSPDGGGSGG